MGFHQHSAGNWSAAAEQTMREFDKNKHRQNIMGPGEDRDSAAIAVATKSVATSSLNDPPDPAVHVLLAPAGGGDFVGLFADP